MQQHINTAAGNNHTLQDLLIQINTDLEEFYNVWLIRKKSVELDKINALKFAFYKMFRPLEFYNSKDTKIRELTVTDKQLQHLILYGEYYASKLTPEKVSSMVVIPRVSKYFSDEQKRNLGDVKQRLCQNFETMRGYIKCDLLERLDMTHFYENIEKNQKLGGYSIY